MVYTHWMARFVPVREFRQDLSAHLDAVADQREHVVVTRNGRPAAVLVPVDEYEDLEETAEILSDPATVAAIVESLSANRADDIDFNDWLSAFTSRRTS